MALASAIESERPAAFPRGWLRAQWEAELADPRWPGTTTHVDAERGYLLRAGAAEILEPYAKPHRRARSADDDEPDDAPDTSDAEEFSPIPDIKRLDARAASALLEVLPPGALKLDLSMFAPPQGVLLRAIAEHPGVVFGGGMVVGPGSPGERLVLHELTILDASVLDVEPDLVALDLPAWLDELSTEDFASYLRERQSCIGHGRTRQAWILASQRYGIANERSFPYLGTVTDEVTGASGLWVGW